MIRPVKALFLLLALAAPAWAQQNPTVQRQVEIRGVIRLPDGRPAPIGIAVSLEMRGGGGAVQQTQTDRGGKFEFRQITPAIYEVHIRGVGYQAAYQEVDATMMPSSYVTFVLAPEALGSGGPAVPPGGPAATISAADAGAPEGARKALQEAEQILSKGGNVDKGLELLKKAAKQYPQYTHAYLLMGAAYSSQKNWDDAQKSFQKAVELSSKDGSAYLGLGAVENEKKNFAEAEKALLTAVGLSPDSPDAHFELARAYLGQQRWELAGQQVEKANQLRPDSPQQHVVMGNILLRERNAQGALKEFQEAVRVDPNGPLAAPSRQMVERIENALKQAAAQQKPAGGGGAEGK